MPKRTPWGPNDDRVIERLARGEISFAEAFETLPQRQLKTLRRHYQQLGDPSEAEYFRRGMVFGSAALLWKLCQFATRRAAATKAA